MIETTNSRCGWRFGWDLALILWVSGRDRQVGLVLAYALQLVIHWLAPRYALHAWAPDADSHGGLAAEHLRDSRIRDRSNAVVPLLLPRIATNVGDEPKTSHPG
jgi:hypothetical protein